MTEGEAVRRAFALAMRTLRQRAGLTQEHLASEGLTRSHVSDLETGRRDPRLSTLVLVARILGISVTKLTAEMERNLERLEVESPRWVLIEEAIKRLRDFMDQSSSMKWLTDTRQGALYCNRPLRDYVGVEHQLAGLAWQELFHPDDLQNYLANSEKKFASREPYLVRYRMRGADGKYKSMLQQAVPQFTPKGIFIGYLGTIIEDPDPEKIATSAVP